MNATGRLTVEVEGLRNDRGHVLVALYDDPAGFPQEGEAFRSGTAEIHGDRATFVFDEVPRGTYAIALLHDENDDGRMNTNRLGIPTEGIGLSNMSTFKLRPPRFEDAAFELDGHHRVVTVKVHYLL